MWLSKQPAYLKVVFVSSYYRNAAYAIYSLGAVDR